MKQILFSRNGIAVVTNGHLKPFRKSLQVLDLSYNEITELESNFFDGLNKLKYVNFRSNKVKHVGLNIQLPVRINFEDNPCINISYRNFSVGELKVGLERQCPLLTPTEVDLKHKINQIETKLEMLSGLILIDIKTKLEKEILELKNMCLEAIQNKLQNELNQTELQEKVFDMNLNNLAKETTGPSSESLKLDENYNKTN